MTCARNCLRSCIGRPMFVPVRRVKRSLSDLEKPDRMLLCVIEDCRSERAAEDSASVDIKTVLADIRLARLGRCMPMDD